MLSNVRPMVTAWTIACQAPLSMRFFRQEYWSGLPFPLPGNFPNPGIESVSLVSPALAGRFFTTVLPGKPQISPVGISHRIILTNSTYMLLSFVIDNTYRKCYRNNFKELAFISLFYCLLIHHFCIYLHQFLPSNYLSVMYYCFYSS